ncbi:MAG: hypothetical protein EG825_02470 [Rhodocyclaceae bacterium]|nr:hypothetical protein [Rhodocyclaceae bacterium]
MLSFLVSGLRAGLRGRSFHAVFVLGILLLFVALLSGSFSPRQPRTVAMDIGLSGMRITLVLLQLIWIQELVAKEIERKTILHSLAYPIPRHVFLLGRYSAVLVLGALAALILGLGLLSAVIIAGKGYSQEFPVDLGIPYWITIFGIALDAAVVTSVGLAISSVSTVSVMPLAVGLVFAVSGKALGATIAYLAGGADGDPLLTQTFNPIIDVIRWIVPDLSRLDWRYWPMYGLQPETAHLVWAMVMAISYIVVAIALALALFRHREFS